MRTNIHKILYALIMTAVCLPTALFAQSPGEEPEEAAPTLFEIIEEQSNGNVEFDIPQSIADRILSTPTAPKKVQTPTTNRQQRPGIHKENGYRVQIFCDGRNQSTLQARAKARGNAVVGRFPKYRGQIYTFSSSPNWYTRVGNFKSQSEANNAMSELRKAFPAFASEMRVVRCQIVTIK